MAPVFTAVEEKKRANERKAPAVEPFRISFEQAFKNIDDVLWKEAGCSSELDYTEQSSWLLFLKYLDDLEQDKSTEAAHLKAKNIPTSWTSPIDGRAGPHPRARMANLTTTRP